MLKDKITCLIFSCDKFSDLWEGNLKMFRDNWPDRDFETYIVTDKHSERTFPDAKVIAAGDNVEWTDRLKYALQFVKTKYVFLTLDDYFQKKMLSVSIDPKQTLYFFACWYLHYDDTAEPDMDYMPYWYRYVCLMAFYNKDISIISNGNILKHKYISDDILEKQIKKIKYNYAYAMVKNDLSNVVYQTNCKYILSKEIFEKIEVNYALIIPTKSIGWKLLSREEWVKYMPYNTNYKMSLTVANFDYTGEEFFGLLDKSSDTADFRTFGYGSSYIYVDSGNDRWQFNRKKSLKTNITFVFDGTNRQYNAFENGSGYGPWTDSNSSSLSFTDNKTTLYLNAYESESNLTNESFTFYEFKIEDKDGNLVKRIVPSDEPKRLYETVSMTYIEPCRTV